MATGGGPPDEALSDQDLPNWSHESLDDRLNNMHWNGQKKGNRSAEKNKKKFVECDLRLTNDISPESSPGVGRRRARTPHTFPHTRYVSQMSVPEQAELEKLKQKINFSDLDQRSIGSDSQGRATAANNKRQLADNRKPFNFLPSQLNTNKEKSKSPPKREASTRSLTKDFLASALNKDFLSNSQAFLEEESKREPAIDSSQVVSRLVQIRDYITKASSLRDDLVQKKDLSVNVERLSNLIEHLKFQEKSYLKFLQKMLASENEEEDVRTVDSAVGSGSVVESTLLNFDVPSEASDTTGVDPRQEAKEELKNMKKQHALLTRMLQQQEQLRTLKGRQAALLALQHKAEQAIAKMDESVVTETTGSVSGLSLTSELNEELNDLIQRFHNQLHDSEDPPAPDNRRQAESLSLAREVYRSRNSSTSDTPLEDKSPLFNNVGVLLEKKQKMDTLLGELHTLQDQQLNNTAFVASSVSPRRSTEQRTLGSAVSSALTSDNRAARSPVTIGAYQTASVNESEDEENQNPAEKLKKLKEVRKRLNELRELVHYYEQTSDMMTDAMNENTKDEDETEDSEYDSEQEDAEPTTNIRNPQYRSSWAQMNINSNNQSGTNNRDERQLNTECEINNRSAVNLRSFNMPSALDCLYNIEHSDKEEDGNRELDDEDAEDQGSRASLSSQNSVADDVQSVDFEQKFNRLVAAKQKLKQLQDLVAMYGDDSESEPVAPERSFSGDQFPPEATTLKQQPNNTRPNVSKAQKDIALKEQAREKFYESKLQQQQRELSQLQEERKKLIEIQEKIQTLRKACPDLQLSTSSAGTNPANRQNRQMTTTTSTPDVNTNGNIVVPAMPDPEDSSSVDNEVWSEIRKHQILREDLRQRRKQLETLMAEHQRRQGNTETTSAASIRSDDSDTQGLQQQTRTEKTMATWGGSTQCALEEEEEEEEVDDEECLSDVHQIDIEEDEQDNTSCENNSYPQNSIRKTSFNGRSSKDGWKNQCPLSVEGNHRPSPKTRQQQNVSMRRQENYRWMSELSHVEEKEHWQEQIDQIKKQLDYSTSICQTLMRDQQALSYLLQSMITTPYSVMPSNVGASQVQLIMHQLNQCYTQLNWQQSNVLRLKQMLNDLLVQQPQHLQGESHQREDRGSSAPPLTSPNIFPNFSFLPPTMNLLNMPAFGSIPNVVPGMNFNPVFPHGFENFTQNVASHTDTPLQPHDQNTSGKTEYMAFPKPFESHRSNSTEKERNPPKKPDESEQGRRVWVENHQKSDQEKKPACFGAGLSAGGASAKLAEESRKVKQFDEVSVESLSSMPDPVDPTTVTKMFKSRKASAQASLASKDKTPKAKNKKRKVFHQKSKGIKSCGFQAASASSASEPNQTTCKHAQTEEVVVGNVIKTSSAQRVEKESKATEMSSEAGSDVSMFETLRDTIYSEVATLISQNESRPHFLIELFHELQLLNTDYLRQKALFALQDIVTRHVSEGNAKKHETCTKALESTGWMASTSELTPSESLVTTDDEMYAKNSDGPVCQEGEQNDGDNISSLSTSSNFEPFATDDLGNTVIHFDQALARMREYERMKSETENGLVADCCNNLNAAASSLEGTNDEARGRAQHSVDDASGIPCPYIDSKQLDRQIKAIMKEVIPFLKEHMEEVCSPNLLTSIRRLVLTLTQQNDESKEFVKFFHKQLGSILQDSLAKFSSKKLKDCGEDLLVEISEVLFNELAFFRLMQDLDNNSTAVQGTVSRKPEAVVVLESFTKEADKEEKTCPEENFSTTRETDDEDKDKDETETAEENRNFDAEVLSGKSDISEEDDLDESLPVSISFTKAETQALTNYGSGEDENEDEENYEFEARPVDVQTSLETSSEIADETEKEEMEVRPEANIENEKALSLAVNVMGELSIHEDQAKSDCDVLAHPSLLLSNEKATDFSGTALVNNVKSPVDSPGTSGAGSSDTESPVLVNDFETGSGNLSQKSDEDDFVKVEDLPLKLSLPQEQIMKDIEEEENKNNLCDEILNINDEENGADQLAGDPLALKEPDSPAIHPA
ncbi:hypothetical protein XELAEV_18005328mg [Xenopus laevis]|uniref:Pericentriolar material 1 protein C-terminal domain-containing protein n=1 Tax=Xenopus laevis TaxID=8355 RepID=A0A974DYY9_XENLA|nr:hypothetical protein XELAEV_18005328mg [Xenopus laevis]